MDPALNAAIKNENLFDPELKKVKFTHRHRKYGVFSNFVLSVGLSKGDFHSVEQFFQMSKFSDGPGTTEMSHEFSEVLKSANTPSKVASMAKQPKHPFRLNGKVNPYTDQRICREVLEIYNREVAPMRSDWDTQRLIVMCEALRAKFDQHPMAKKLLLATHRRELIEHAPWDAYWGNGRNERGQNMLGRLLMAIRNELILRDPEHTEIDTSEDED